MACMEKSHHVSLGSTQPCWRTGLQGSVEQVLEGPAPPAQALQAVLEASQNQWADQELLFTGHLCARPFDKTLFYKSVPMCVNIFVSCLPSFYEKTGAQRSWLQGRGHAFPTYK